MTIQKLPGMVRPVRLDLSGDIINIEGEVNVHRSLLCDISPKMQSLVEDAEKLQKTSASHRARSKTVGKYPLVRLQLFNRGDLEGAARGLEMWSSFLYGQSMLVSQSRLTIARVTADEYTALLRVHEIAQEYNHEDAVDAALDAIRQLIHHGLDLSCSPGVFTSSSHRDSSLVRMLLDFVIYGEQGKNWTKLIDARTGPTESPDLKTRMMVEASIKSQSLGDLLCVTIELCKMFVRKAEDERAGRALPDLMERGRYHSHADHGGLCYLDKVLE